MQNSQQKGTVKMAEKIASINQVVNGFIWGAPAMICIIGVGLLLSVRTRFIQIRKFGVAMKNTVGKIFDKTQAKDGSMSPFQAVCTALAGTVGTGNIAGVAGAIALGGPGAIFWMWCSAFLGMCTKFSEVTLAIHFREKNSNGEYVLPGIGICRSHIIHTSAPRQSVCFCTKHPKRIILPNDSGR